MPPIVPRMPSRVTAILTLAMGIQGSAMVATPEYEPEGS